MRFALKQLSILEPADLIQARVDALEAAEFKFIYASYHPDSNFRRNFKSCGDYLTHARTESSVAPQIDTCTILAEDIESTTRARVLYHIQITFTDGSGAAYYEVAELKRVSGGWRYVCGYKVAEEELAVVESDAISCEMIIERGVCF
jgi:SEC-C motif-containing protein